MAPLMVLWNVSEPHNQIRKKAPMLPSLMEARALGRRAMRYVR